MDRTYDPIREALCDVFQIMTIQLRISIRIACVQLPEKVACY